MQAEFMHIDWYAPSAGGITSLWTRLNQSSSLTLRGRAENLQGTETSELALAFITKLEMLREIVGRLDEEIRQLNDSVANDASGEVDKCIAEEWVYTLPDPRLPFRVLADLDSFLYQTKSACEVMAGFAMALFRDILGKRPGIKAVKKEFIQFLSDASVDMGWYTSLEKLRNLFIHNTAPWLAVKRISDQPVRFDLVLLKKNVRTFDNPDEWVELDEYRKIHSGFTESLPVYLQWLRVHIEEFEKREAAGQQ